MSGMTLSEFIAMGGYGAYVWGSFGLSFIVFVGNIMASRRLRQRVLLEISQMKQASPNTFTESRADGSKTTAQNTTRESS